jgi:protein LTV1
MDDDRFQDRLDKEYADDQIGDVDGEVEVDEDGIITAEALDDAVNEFIESQKIRDRKLYKDFRPNKDTEPPELVPIIRKPYVPTQEELDDPKLAEKEREEIIKKSLLLAQKIDQEDAEKGSDDTSSEEESEDEEKRWDVDTILTTHTNTDNHPAIIKTAGRVVRTGKQRIELHKQFKVPLDGLMAEEIEVKREGKK